MRRVTLLGALVACLAFASMLGGCGVKGDPIRPIAYSVG